MSSCLDQDQRCRILVGREARHVEPFFLCAGRCGDIRASLGAAWRGLRVKSYDRTPHLLVFMMNLQAVILIRSVWTLCSYIVFSSLRAARYAGVPMSRLPLEDLQLDDPAVGGGLQHYGRRPRLVASTWQVTVDHCQLWTSLLSEMRKGHFQDVGQEAPTLPPFLTSSEVIFYSAGFATLLCIMAGALPGHRTPCRRSSA